MHVEGRIYSFLQTLRMQLKKLTSFLLVSTLRPKILEQVCYLFKSNYCSNQEYHISGSGKAPNLKFVERAARDIAETVLSGNKIVVEKSTVPVKAAESIATILSAKKNSGVNFQV